MPCALRIWQPQCQNWRCKWLLLATKTLSSDIYSHSQLFMGNNGNAKTPGRSWSYAPPSKLHRALRNEQLPPWSIPALAMLPKTQSQCRLRGDIKLREAHRAARPYSTSRANCERSHGPKKKKRKGGQSGLVTAIFIGGVKGGIFKDARDGGEDVSMRRKRWSSLFASFTLWWTTFWLWNSGRIQHVC